MKSMNTELLAILAECADACNHCSVACLEEEDVKKMVACIRLDLDCAQICRLSSAFIARGSEHARHLLWKCAEICGKCAAECEKHKVDHCIHCAEACRKCGAACKAYKE